MEKKKNKVLIISHNPFSTYQSMGKTFLSLFETFKKDELCQLYIYPAVPDVDTCHSFYRITDKDVLKFYYKLRVRGEKVVPNIKQHSIYEHAEDEKIYNNPKNKNDIRKIIRDILWKFAPWYNRSLKSWLDEEAPTCIFLAPGYAKFIYDIALKISKDYGIPIITYICDDYYFTNVPTNCIGNLQHKLLCKKIRKTIHNTKLIVGISKEITEKYAESFSIDTALIMTGSNLENVDETIEKKEVNCFSYFGNIGLNREKPLADIGRVLDEINNENNTDYKLMIYTGTQSDAVETEFRNIKSIKMCGFLTGEAFEREFKKADCLVHVESFDDNISKLVSGSISTKIADSLASGIPMLAYAPAKIASTEHLRRNDCAFIADCREELKGTIFQILNDHHMKRRISENAIHTAQRYHVSSKNSKYLKSLFEGIIGD